MISGVTLPLIEQMLVYRETLSSAEFRERIVELVKQKSEVLNTWRVGMNNFARIAEGQDNTRNILDPKTFLEFLVKIFTLGYVDFSKRSNEAGRNMMAHIE
ncbi:hypothetical protein O5964_28255, partial [Escherichia coli]|nr:hypothetical protein [Escherichia coli]